MRLEYNINISDDYVNECFATDERLLCQLTGMNYNFSNDYLIRNLNEDLLAHESNLRENWIKFSEKLQPFTRAPNAVFE